MTAKEKVSGPLTEYEKAVVGTAVRNCRTFTTTGRNMRQLLDLSPEATTNIPAGVILSFIAGLIVLSRERPKMFDECVAIALKEEKLLFDANGNAHIIGDERQ